MTTDLTAALAPTAIAAGHPRVAAHVPETPVLGATAMAPHPTAPVSPRVATGAVAASARAPRAATVAASQHNAARPLGGARAASSVARG